MLLTTPKVSLAAIEVFIKFAANFLETEGSLIEAATEACSALRRAEAKAFFVENGFDEATVTPQYLEQCAAACGWHKQVLRPRNTFKDMLDCIKQYDDGLVTKGELIMALQMVPHQVVACSLYNSLPLPLHRKASLADWDESIAGDVEKGCTSESTVRSSMSKDAIVLDRYLRIGDRVVMQMDKEARNWGRKGVPDGTCGTVIGFNRYERYIPRIGGFGRPPGRYMCNGVGIVAWDNGSADTPGAGDLRWAENHRDLDRVRRIDKTWNDAFETNQFVEPLPELPFWEHDIVRDKTGRLKMGHRDDHLLRISTIEYHHLHDKRDDGSPMPIYNVEAPEGRSGYTWTNTDDLELVERGNVWKWFNGERAAIKWKDLREEAGFHRLLGACDEVRNPRTTFYVWEQSDVLSGLQEGLIDAPAVSAGFFGAGPTVHCYRFHDRDLGERVRAEALKGFTQQPSNS